MLRIHFTDADLARTRVINDPDPLWELGQSLHRFQTRQGRWAYAHWYRGTCQRLRESGQQRILRELLLPLFRRGPYYPDFLNPAESSEGLQAGLEAVLATPPRRVLDELRTLAGVSGAPPRAPELARPDGRRELVRALRDYHDTAIAPYAEEIQSRIDADRVVRCRALLDGGVEALLGGLGPDIRWQRPVLHVRHPSVDRDLRLGGRGLTLVPSYFCWQTPVSMADPAMPPVLVYPLHQQPSPVQSAGASLTALLGRTRATVLRAVAAGATTGELARVAGVSASSISQHTTVLRDAGLITSQRQAASVLHTLTPLGASMLQANLG
ncbi:helix-turn-helix domain-containing protein [Streptomyces sp. NPDC001833]|uniref:ArsR/SmtB family transcription factor n=1 Tax=Streptomyces sp. NPDC001833 TaxID=3154658 RepID=UPI00333273C5